MSEVKHKNSSPDPSSAESSSTVLSIPDGLTYTNYEGSNKFILIDAQQELHSIRKLADETDFLPVDSNNNEHVNTHNHQQLHCQPRSEFQRQLQLQLQPQQQQPPQPDRGQRLRNPINNSSEFLSSSETTSASTSTSTSTSLGTSTALRLLRMDVRRKANSPTSRKSPSARLASANSPSNASSAAANSAVSEPARPSAILDLPSVQSTSLDPDYPSIFVPSAYRQSASPQQRPQQQQQQLRANQPGMAAVRQNGSRANLNKQGAVASTSTNETESPAGSLNRLPNRKLIPFSYGNKEQSVSSQQDEEETVEPGEEETDERVPFGAYLNKNQSGRSRRISPANSAKSPPSPSKQSLVAQEMAQQQKHNPHTKISINTDSRPPSFNMCQSNGFQEALMSRKLDWQEHMGVCPKCDCSSCRKKRKIATLDGQIARQNFGRQQVLPNQVYLDPMRQSRTKTVHLVLKSIILVLLTLLLLMLLLGMLAASHYLPQMFDRVLNVSRSFNVTIAG